MREGKGKGQMWVKHTALRSVPRARPGILIMCGIQHLLPGGQRLKDSGGLQPPCARKVKRISYRGTKPCTSRAPKVKRISCMGAENSGRVSEGGRGRDRGAKHRAGEKRDSRWREGIMPLKFRGVRAACRGRLIMCVIQHLLAGRG